jgi:hypothetical protein
MHNRTLNDIDVNHCDFTKYWLIAELLNPNPVILEVTLDDDHPAVQSILERNSEAQTLAVRSVLCLISSRKLYVSELSVFPKEIVLMIAKMVFETRLETCWWQSGDK